MDVSVDVALGLGTTEERMMMLAGIAQKQEKILETQGEMNPFVTPQQYHHTLVKMTELSGFKDTQSFWSNPKDFQPPPPPEPEPTAEEIFATAQADKVRADIELDRQKFALDQEKMVREDDLERDKLESDLELKTQEMENKYKTTIDQTDLKGRLDRDREQLKLEAMKIQQMQQVGQQQTVPPMRPEEMSPENSPLDVIPN